MFKSHGYLQIEQGVRILTPLDLILYYQKLFSLATWHTRKFQTPKHLGHISIYLPNIHGENGSMAPIKHLNGHEISFQYDPADITITQKNVWMKVICEEAQAIKDNLKIVDKNFLGFHLVICNFKFEK
jgi:hypothetical protein